MRKAEETNTQIDWDSFPNVTKLNGPALRRPLFVNSLLSPDQKSSLETKGWDIVDVRLSPEESFEQRATNVLNFLSGVRAGSIIGNSTMFKFIELESRIVGLYGAKGSQKKVDEIDPEDTDAMLSFAKAAKNK